MFSSDLARASETAAAIAEPLKVRVRPMPELREMSYGVAGGKPQA